MVWVRFIVEGVGDRGGAGSAHREDVEDGMKWIEVGVGVGGCAASAHSSLLLVLVGVKLDDSGDSVSVVVVVVVDAAAVEGGRCFCFFRRLNFACRISCRRRIV